jgi:hypothetical protein
MNQDLLFYVFRDEKNLPTAGPQTFQMKLDGAQFPTLAKLYLVLNKELQFGGTFGNNLDALFDSMTDLSWRTEKKFRFFFTNSEDFLIDEDDDTLIDFLNTLNDISGSINDEPSFSEQSRSMTFYFQSTDRIEQLLDDAYIIWEPLD